MDNSSSKHHFKKKTYKKLTNSPLKSSIGSHTISSLGKETSCKKIIPTKASKGIRDAFKETFLPLLIDVFELRQIIDNHKTAQEKEVVLGKVNKSPKEIIERLEQIGQDVKESKRWCEGVILQIEQGISEAKETLKLIEQSPQPTQKARHKAKSFFAHLLKIARFGKKE